MLLSAGDLGGARKIASEAAAASAASLRAEAELLLGDLDWIGGSWARAIEHLESAIAAEPEDPALAARAYQFIYSIVKTSSPFVWPDIADAFPDEVIMVLQQPAAGKVDPKYLPWPDNDQPTDKLFRYEMDGFGNYHFHAL